jgi:hypothetical protein
VTLDKIAISNVNAVVRVAAVMTIVAVVRARARHTWCSALRRSSKMAALIGRV